MKVTALLTGRGNNSLKDKNILDILNKPVLYYPANAAKKVKSIDSFFCSSDDDKILTNAASYGYTPIKRPAELALPTSQHKDCIIHALSEIKEKYNITPDIIVVLLANNVSVLSQWISDCISIMEKDPAVTAVVPVYADNDHHPLRAKIINNNGTLDMYEKGINTPVSTNRQDLPECLFIAHNFWILRTDYVLSGKEGQAPWGFMGDKIIPYRIDESVDIHKYSDLLLAAEWIKNNYTD